MTALPAEPGRQLPSSAEWRLTTHFFRAMFDFGVLGEAGADALRHMLLGAIGGMVTFGLLLTRVLFGRYAQLSSYPTPEPYRRAMLGDDMLIIGLPMLFAAFITLMVSQSLFPDERDFRILGPLPLRRSTVFATKFAGLLLFTGLFIVVAHVTMLPWMLVSSASRWLDHSVLVRLGAWAIASVSASYFAVFTVCAVVGALTLTLTGGRLQAIGALMKSGMFAALVLCIPLVLQVPTVTSLLAARSAWLALVPPAWFLGLQRTIAGRANAGLLELAAVAVGALALVVVVTAGIYLLLFRHFERLVLQPVRRSSNRARTRRATILPWAPPAFRAIAGFTVTTLARSQLHQSVLVGLSIFGVGIALNGIVGASERSLANVPYWGPFALMLVSGAAMRLSLSFPMQHRANWIFKMTEDPATRGDQLRAVDRVTATWVAAMPASVSLIIWWIAKGQPSPVAAGVVALVGLVFVHWVLLDWRRIPFTCSYLPGKRFIAYTAMVGFFQCAIFMLSSVGLVRVALSSMTSAAIIAVILSAVAWLLRRRRLTGWSRTPLMFEDELPDRPQELQL